MDHKKTYDQIIDRARDRGLDKSLVEGYHERHHVIPKCLGGTNEDDNLVLLTAREHFIAHVLLCYVYPNNDKILLAWNMMHVVTEDQSRVTSRQYKYLRQRFSKFISNRHKGNTYNVGIKRSEKTLKIMSEVQKGKKMSPDNAEKLRIRNTGNSYNLGYKPSKDAIKRMIASSKIVCEYCGRQTTKQIISQWHGPIATRTVNNRSTCARISIINGEWTYYEQRL